MIALKPLNISAQIAEIDSDRALQTFGVILALSHCVTAYFWSIGRVGYALSDMFSPICWPGLDFCFGLPRLTYDQVLWWLKVYGSAGVGVALLFALRQTSAAWWSLLLVALTILLIMATDIRSALNIETIGFWLTGTFLFLPLKRRMLQVLIVLIYFLAGLIKLNTEWLSGDSLGRIPEWLSVLPIEVLTSYVILLELGIVWLLLQRRQLWFWLALAQLVAFQATAYAFIGFYFPTVMLAFLMIFPLAKFIGSQPGQPEKFKLGTGHVLAFLVLVLCQLAPHLIAREPVYTGEGKYFSIHMFDTMVECDPKVAYLNADGVRVERQFYPPDMRASNPRLTCNPISFYWRARAACRDGFDGFKPSDFDLLVKVKKRAEKGYREPIAVEKFCARNLTYLPFSHNRWLAIH